MEHNIYAHFIKRTIAIIVLSVTGITGAAARGTTITAKDRENIIASATLTLTTFIKDIDIVSDENYPVSAKTGTIDMAFNSQDYICKKNATIEDDMDPSVHTSGKSEITIADYLNNLMTTFKRRDTTYFKPFDILCIKLAKDKSMYIQVPFVELLNGTDMNGTPYTKNNRIASITITQSSNGEWKSIITAISFYDPAKYKNEGCIEIAGANPDPVVKTDDKKPDSYYPYMLLRGSRLLAESKYAEAYFSLKEAEQSPIEAAKAKQKITELYDNMRAAGSQGVNDALSGVLTLKGRDLESTHKYQQACQYYSYALDLNPTSADLRNRKSGMDDKASFQKQLSENFDKQQYAQGISDYTIAISRDPENSGLYIGRAKCYGQLNNDREAKNDFNKAANYDPSNREVYYWKGKYFEQKNSIIAYDSAYAAFISFVAKSDDKLDPAAQSAAAEATFCKGMSLYMQGVFPEAIDSFAAAIKQKEQYSGKEQYKEAWCYQGCCYLKINETEKAFKCFSRSSEIDDKYPDAHFRYGEALLRAGGKKNSDKGIIEMEKGIGLLSSIKNDNWYSWNSEMGDALSQNQRYDEAIVYYDKCVDENSDPEYTLRRGECYMHKGEKDKARSDYQKYLDQCKKKNIPQAMRFQRDNDEINKGK